MNAKNYIYDDNGVYIKNLANNAEQYGITQYRFPHNFELAGKTVTVEAGGKEYTLDFKCRKNVLFNGNECGYECEKAAPDLYFVRFGYDCAVIDLGKSVATLVLGEDYILGTIKGGSAKTEDIHSFAKDDMIGTKVRWVLGCGRYVNQEFIASDKVKTSWSPRDEKYAENACKEIKLGGAYYLVDMKTDTLKDVCAPFFTNHVVMFQDYDRCMTVGCVFGKGFDPMMITGYAKFLD